MPSAEFQHCEVVRPKLPLDWKPDVAPTDSPMVPDRSRTFREAAGTEQPTLPFRAPRLVDVFAPLVSPPLCGVRALSLCDPGLSRGHSARPRRRRPGGALFPVEQDGQWRYINRTGEIVIEPQLDRAYRFSGTHALIRQEGRHGFIDPSGSVSFHRNTRTPGTSPTASPRCRSTACGASSIRRANSCSTRGSRRRDRSETAWPASEPPMDNWAT